MNDESSIDGCCPVPFSMFSTGTFAGSLMTDSSASAAWKAAQTPAFQAALADESVIKDPANVPVLNMLNGTGQQPSIDDSSFISHLDPRLADPFLEGFAQSIGLVLLVAAVVLAIGFAVSFTLPELELRQVSGIQSRMDDDAETAAAATAAATLVVAASEQASERAQRSHARDRAPLPNGRPGHADLH